MKKKCTKCSRMFETDDESKTMGPSCEAEHKALILANYKPNANNLGESVNIKNSIFGLADEEVSGLQDALNILRQKDLSPKQIGTLLPLAMKTSQFALKLIEVTPKFEYPHIKKLSRHHSYNVRAKVAQHSSADSEILRHLYNDKNDYVKKVVIRVRHKIALAQVAEFLNAPIKKKGKRS